MIIDDVRELLTDDKLARIVLFIRHSYFTPENKKIAELKELIMTELFGNLKDLTIEYKYGGSIIDITKPLIDKENKKENKRIDKKLRKLCRGIK